MEFIPSADSFARHIIIFRRKNREFNLTVAIVVAVYMLAMLFIGWYSSTRITSNSDFMVAGRRLGPC